jgi:hypothetical protein
MALSAASAASYIPPVLPSSEAYTNMFTSTTTSQSRGIETKDEKNVDNDDDNDTGSDSDSSQVSGPDTDSDNDNDDNDNDKDIEEDKEVDIDQATTVNSSVSSSKNKRRTKRIPDEDDEVSSSTTTSKEEHKESKRSRSHKDAVTKSILNDGDESGCSDNEDNDHHNDIDDDDVSFSSSSSSSISITSKERSSATTAGGRKKVVKKGGTITPSKNSNSRSSRSKEMKELLKEMKGFSLVENIEYINKVLQNNVVKFIVVYGQGSLPKKLKSDVLGPIATHVFGFGTHFCTLEDLFRSSDESLNAKWKSFFDEKKKGTMSNIDLIKKLHQEVFKGSDDHSAQYIAYIPGLKEDIIRALLQFFSTLKVPEKDHEVAVKSIRQVLHTSYKYDIPKSEINKLIYGWNNAAAHQKSKESKEKNQYYPYIKPLFDVVEEYDFIIKKEKKIGHQENKVDLLRAQYNLAKDILQPGSMTVIRFHPAAQDDGADLLKSLQCSKEFCAWVYIVVAAHHNNTLHDIPSIPIPMLATP